MPQKEKQTDDYSKAQDKYGQKNNPSEKTRGKLHKEKTNAGVIDSAVSESQSLKNYQ
ncbi:MAG: hypothetical protein GYA55_10780 [SAR324 cluster bacterium]|uniref:Uncharacterized protein n=1 Tax=SAR324 cluster bacterium TaxID=2024889 RepID=A0A7X9FSV8_9DELT|nr:hypothetical protein [SAR324 cluster bacterium]